jgi:hypothetical protein
VVLLLSYRVDGFFTLKRCVFSTIAQNTLFFLLSSEISAELTGCFEMSLVLKPVNVVAFLVKVQ